MQLFIFVATFFVLSSIALATNGVGPLCQNQECNEGETCRVVESCTPADSNACAVEAMCLSSNPGRYGCRIGKPLLKPKDGGGYELRSCWEDHNCPDGFYCSTELMDTSSRCCETLPVL